MRDVSQVCISILAERVSLESTQGTEQIDKRYLTNQKQSLSYLTRQTLCPYGLKQMDALRRRVAFFILCAAVCTLFTDAFAFVGSVSPPPS